MKNVQYLFIVLLSAFFLLNSCSTNGHSREKMKTQKDAEDEFLATLTAADSSTVFTLCTQCMDFFKAKEVDKAFDMLYSINDSGVARPLSPQKRTELAKRFEHFPVINYKMDYFSFSTQGNNDVKYKIEFTPRPNPETSGSSMGFMFNPIKIDGQWILAIKDGAQPSREVANPLHHDAPAPVDVVMEK